MLPAGSSWFTIIDCGKKTPTVAGESDSEIAGMADDVIFVPETLDLFSPLLNVIPLQLFAYHMPDLRGCDIDKPRNLAKSVTVE